MSQLQSWFGAVASRTGLTRAGPVPLRCRRRSPFCPWRGHDPVGCGDREGAMPRVQHPVVGLGDRKAPVVFGIEPAHELLGFGPCDPVRVGPLGLRHRDPGRRGRIQVPIPSCAVQAHQGAGLDRGLAGRHKLPGESQDDVFPGFGVNHSGRWGSGSFSSGSVADALLAIASKSAEAFPRMSTAASDRASLALRISFSFRTCLSSFLSPSRNR